ncbi:Bifunctional uridylyltransferase/uridylyl-removing enzyme (Includes: (Protein-PII) uridylyltransferase; (Protein-PII)-UMP uridylyl-removing enzyme) [Crenothrix polyspora]|uniref:Bifunctional uridylyltransferase/uridylyl-removing enzyme n=2 Tax=Crenothrix polyspora TaxID=360316 RepID=A0A1R4H0D6_9GAMM|nr:[protein-PII] uridylyltransferase [Crenothrix polyspora]SJM89675.1 Bifunctional uridylyltransferase/uridylyl-removing enzyme (Includes: (Protein-PII) uridylyltransferase; (Protein-PII)-UMP uridylyl-removing enzyme) [Crenothrix polyspora]
MNTVNTYITVALFDDPNSVQQFRLLMKYKDEELQQKFDPHQSVSKLLIEKSSFIDKILSVCWQHFLGNQAQQLCLMAVGGYGRRELFPYSDIDIVGLLPSDDISANEALANFFTFLWDIGLKPGHSVRTIQECVEIAKNDQTIMTSLMENRLIVGNTTLYKSLRSQITPDKIWPSDRFFAAKMKEQRLRYAKFHDTAYNLEPNVKEGPGGLRDRQVIAWVFKRHYNSATLHELIKYGFLPESEYAELVAALEVLWRIRYALHLLTKRGEDRLIFDYQRDLAEQFGFKTENQQYNQDVEQFMQFYFKTVQGLERLNEMLLQLFHERFVTGETACMAQPFNDKFVTVNGYLEAIDDSVFERHPSALLEIFLMLQQNTALKGIRATTIRLIRKNLYLIDQHCRENKVFNHLFVEIFRQPHGLTTQLRRMNRYGVLAAYLPAFANIVARMQYDLFHIYTVDEHTLFVIRNLRRFSLEKHRHELPFCNDICLLTTKPEILYFAALFHDIAKGKNGDHSTLGEVIAKEFCKQHELSSHDSKLITWLVQNHLLMSTTAQRKDIGDPDIIHEFAQKVGSVEYLNHLYLLTVADIRATNPELWNSWKDVLLKELYSLTHKALRKGLQNPVAIADRLLENKKEAKEELLKLGLSEPVIDNAWQHTSDDYFLRYSADEIAWHTMAIASSTEDNLPLVLLRVQTRRGSAEVFVYAHDEGGIFSISTATLDQLGLSIVDARIITTLDNYVLNSFQVLEQSGEPLNEAFREAHICTTLRHNLLHKQVKEHTNIHRLSRQAKYFPIPTQILFHSEPLNRYTVLELITTDYAGLLSRIGKAFIQEGINLHSAKITTIGSRAEDMFYITDQQLCPIDDPVKQEQLRKTILNILDVG